MTIADLDRVIEAMGAMLADVQDEHEAHEAEDEGFIVAAHMPYGDVLRAREALALLRTMRDGATEMHAWRFGGAWHASESYRGTAGDIDLTPALLITPED